MARHWFRAKEYGWGWTPSTWEGWGVIMVYMGVVVLLVKFLAAMGDTPSTAAFVAYGLGVAGATCTLIGVCFMKGEKPGWRWGKK